MVERHLDETATAKCYSLLMVNKVKKRRRGLTRVSSKFQVTIPRAIAAAAGVKPGDTLRVDNTTDGRLILVPEIDPVQALAGSFHYPVNYLAELREEWQ